METTVDPEAAIEWLRRTERDLEEKGIDPTEIVTFNRWRQTLLSEFGYTDKQIETLWEHHVWHEDKLKALGIRMVSFWYERGPRAGQHDVRWVIRGYPGLWGFERMKEIAIELGLEIY